jgi:hypothetical protein
MRPQVCADSWLNTHTIRCRSNVVDKTLEALLPAAKSRRAIGATESEFKEFALALLTLEILGLARSIPHDDNTRSWCATDELEWLASRDCVVL